MANDQADLFRSFARDVFTCRLCRTNNPKLREATADDSRPPEISHGPDRPSLLIVSINPKLDRDREPKVDFERYLAAASDQSMPSGETPFVAAIRAVLPEGLRWGGNRSNVTNTRVFKCATDSAAGFGAVAKTCGARFLGREAQLLQPLLVWVYGADVWHVASPFLGIDASTLPKGALRGQPFLRIGRLEDRPVPIVFTYHLSGQHPLGKTPLYRASVKDALGRALAMTNA